MLELTRDARTVFVSQLVARLTEREIREFFEKVRGRGYPLVLSAPAANTFSLTHSLSLLFSSSYLFSLPPPPVGGLCEVRVPDP